MSDDLSPDVIVGGVVGVGVRGSKRYSCVHCRCDAWLAPSSQGMLAKNPEIKVVCFECYLKNPDMPRVPSGVSSRAEIQDILLDQSEEATNRFIEEGIRVIGDLKDRQARMEPWKKN
jgi:hypothetical protein